MAIFNDSISNLLRTTSESSSLLNNSVSMHFHIIAVLQPWTSFHASSFKIIKVIFQTAISSQISQKEYRARGANFDRS